MTSENLPEILCDLCGEPLHRILATVNYHRPEHCIQVLAAQNLAAKKKLGPVIFAIQCISCSEVYSLWSSEKAAKDELARLRQFPEIEELPEAHVRRRCEHAFVCPWPIDQPDGFGVGPSSLT